jgi:hypothetical protein
MPRLNNDGRDRLRGRQRKQFGKRLMSAFDLDSFDNMLANQLGIRREEIALGKDYETIVYRVIDDAERKWYTAELLQAARAERQTDLNLLEFSQQFGLEPSFVEPERLVRETLGEIDPEPWLKTATERLGQICRIDIPEAYTGGTGFLVGPDLILTNYHVVAQIIEYDDDDLGSSIEIRFDQRVRSNLSKTSQPVRLRSSEWLVDFSPDSNAAFEEIPTAALDYALLRIAESARPGEDRVDDGKERGWVPIPTFPYKFAKDSPLFVLGHPRGDSLKMTLDTNSIMEINQQKSRVRYRTNTDSGSSGSPCFDLQWNLVALHHAGDTAKIAQFNEGIPVSTIRRMWKEKVDSSELDDWKKDVLDMLRNQNFDRY